MYCGNVNIFCGVKVVLYEYLIKETTLTHTHIRHINIKRRVIPLLLLRNHTIRPMHELHPLSVFPSLRVGRSVSNNQVSFSLHSSPSTSLLSLDILYDLICIVSRLEHPADRQVLPP